MPDYEYAPSEFQALLDGLCDESLDNAQFERINEILRASSEARQAYLRYVDLHVTLRLNAESAAVDEMLQGYANDSELLRDVREETATLRGAASSHQSSDFSLTRLKKLLFKTSRIRLATAATIGLIAGLATLSLYRTAPPPNPITVVEIPRDAFGNEIPLAHLAGAVGARWAGAALEITEMTHFSSGQRLELIEGLAEIAFRSGSRMVIQGPAIIEIDDSPSVFLALGRATVETGSGDGEFVLRTALAEVSSVKAEYGIDVDVDSSVRAQIFAGQVRTQFKGNARHELNTSLVVGDGIAVAARSGQVTPLKQTSELHFVRFLPQHSTFIGVADLVAGSREPYVSARSTSHAGIDLRTGVMTSIYTAPAIGDGSYHVADELDAIDGVFIPDGNQRNVQVDSIGRYFGGFPPTKNNCWGGAIMTRFPDKEESLPLIELQVHDNVSGYLNWLHIAAEVDALSPKKYGIVGMHSNSGLTIDLHAIRKRFPDKKVTRFRALVGNLERKSTEFEADVWLLVDGTLKYERNRLSGEDGSEEIDIPLDDRDRFLVLAVTDAGDTAFDWVAFGDAVIELTENRNVSAGADSRRRCDRPEIEEHPPEDSSKRNESLPVEEQLRLGMNFYLFQSS